FGPRRAPGDRGPTTDPSHPIRSHGGPPGRESLRGGPPPRRACLPGNRGLAADHGVLATRGDLVQAGQDQDDPGGEEREVPEEVPRPLDDVVNVEDVMVD